MRTALRILLSCLFGGMSAGAAEPVEYLRDVKPILREKCYACHGALKQEAGLRLDTVAAIRRGGDSGSALDETDPLKSLLFTRVTLSDPTERMPLEATPCSPEQLEKLRNWLQQGAPAAAGERPETDPREHWSFRPPVRPSLPTGSAYDADNPIDVFVAVEYAARGLKPRPLAERSLLLRRVTLDLTGLPPTSQELADFLADDRPDAYDRVVDRLLNSPQYGERWARHWMDVWRYADWHGRRNVPDVWNSAPQIWRWRDWIVQSLNEDKGYDRMIAEMLAADEIAPEDDHAAVATGYLVRNWYALNPNDWMRQNVEHTAKAFLGLTFHCAHCHDHKYDPISQRDYFSFRAFFEPIGIRQDRVPGEPDPGPFQEYRYSVLRKVVRHGAVRIFDQHTDAPTWFYTGGDERNRDQDQGNIPPGVPAIFGADAIQIRPVELPPVAHYPGLRPTLHDALRRELEATVAQLAAEQDALEQSTEQQRRDAWEKWHRDPEDFALRRDWEQLEQPLQIAKQNLAVAQAEFNSWQARWAADRAKYGIDKDADAEALARRAHEAEGLAAAAHAEATILQAQGQLAQLTADPASAADEAQKKQIDAAQKQLDAGFAALTAARQQLAHPEKQWEYTPFSPAYPRQSSGRRRALAEWIASPTNPLTARVAVNHIWMRHFQTPLVETVFDFGRNGKLPSNPKLLDWLAVEFMDSGWSSKHLHRLIVTSRTYQLSSSAGDVAENVQRDPQNTFYWRQNVGRLESEVVRDSLLACSERLDLRMGGQELENTEALTTRRRTLYYSCQPELDGKSELGALFDAPDALDCYRRSKSIIPQQALALSNSALVHEVSGTIASQLWESLSPEEQTGADRFIESALVRILARSPREPEWEPCRRFLQAGQASHDGPAVGDEPARAGLVRVLLNHNDFISVR